MRKEVKLKVAGRDRKYLAEVMEHDRRSAGDNAYVCCWHGAFACMVAWSKVRNAIAGGKTLTVSAGELIH